MTPAATDWIGRRVCRECAKTRSTWVVESSTVLDDADLQAIRRLEQRWLAEELAGNASAVLEFCTDDVVWMPPSERTLRGKAAVRAWLAGPPPRIEDLQLSNVRIEGDGSVACKVADYQARYVPDGSSDPVTSAGSHVWVLRRGADSTWRVALLAWTFFQQHEAV
jgi:uncharacterized protein (TIGR02246 family)